MKMATIQIPMHFRALVVEDSDIRNQWFREKLPGCTVATSPQLAISNLLINHNSLYDIVFLDHDARPVFIDPADPDFLDKTFWRVAQYLRRIEFKGMVVIHSGNPVGAARMEALLGATCKVAVLPFGMFDIEVIK